MSAKENNKSIEVINLTKLATIVMIIVCAVADIFGYYICQFVWSEIVTWEYRLISNYSVAFPMLIALFYICTIFAYVILFSVLKLLNNMKKNEVFIKENTNLMKKMAIGCFLIFASCVAGSLIWPSILFIGVVGLFMGLIVQCVRVVMDKAIDMRDELDLTV